MAYNPSPYRDPGFLEQSRNSDASTSLKERGSRREAQVVQNELRRNLPRIAWQSEDRKGAIGSDYESRGLAGSGAQFVDQAKVDRDSLADANDLRMRAAEQIQALAAQAAEARLAASGDLANAGLSAFGRLAGQPSEGAIAGANQRQAALQAQLQALIGRYGR
jgi:hypothetical protein